MKKLSALPSQVSVLYRVMNLLPPTLSFTRREGEILELEAGHNSGFTILSSSVNSIAQVVLTNHQKGLVKSIVFDCNNANYGEWKKKKDGKLDCQEATGSCLKNTRSQAIGGIPRNNRCGKLLSEAHLACLRKAGWPVTPKKPEKQKSSTLIYLFLYRF